MKEEKVDVSGKKDVKIIRPGREVEEYSENHAILDIVRETERSCSDIDPFGQDTVLDCITCSNSDYQIVLKGKKVKEFQDKNSKQNQETKTRYIIEFFEDIPDQKSLSDYLENENSNYRITRDSDGVILRPSLEDRRKKEEEQAKLRADFKEMERKMFGPYLAEPLKEEESKSSSVSIGKKKLILERIFKPQKTHKNS